MPPSRAIVLALLAGALLPAQEGSGKPVDAAASRPALPQPVEPVAVPAASDAAAKTTLAEVQKMLAGRATIAQRLEAVQKLGAASHKSFVRPLQNLVRNDPALTVRRGAADALARQPTKETRPVLLNLLQDEKVEQAPELLASLVTALGHNGYQTKDWDQVEKMFGREFGPTFVPLQKAVLHLARTKKEKQAVPLLLQHIDEPAPENVDAADNPPAEYWERRWKAWAVWKGEVKDALFAITGQRFSTRQEAVLWLRANGQRLGIPGG